MYVLVIGIHIIVSLVLIAVILLQSGRGSGLNEAFGMSSTQTIMGQSAPTFLQHATTACAITFMLTSIFLAVLTSHRSKSLLMQQSRKGAMTVPLKVPHGTAPVQEEANESTNTATIPVQTPMTAE